MGAGGGIEFGSCVVRLLVSPGDGELGGCGDGYQGSVRINRGQHSQVLCFV